jgi:hypothetical protein
MPEPSSLQKSKERKLVSKLAKTLRSGHVHISLATGISILGMAFASRWLLPEPIPYLHLAAPPFLMTIYEALVSKKKYKRYTKSSYWVIGILAATLLVIGANLI